MGWFFSHLLHSCLGGQMCSSYESSLSALVETAKHCFQASTLLLKQPSWRTIVLHKSISNVVVAGAPEMLVLPEAKQGIPAV